VYGIGFWSFVIVDFGFWNMQLVSGICICGEFVKLTVNHCNFAKITFCNALPNMCQVMKNGLPCETKDKIQRLKVTEVKLLV
jgi:hypothetical protein